MNCLGIDYGVKRIGLSFGDELGIAVPLPAILSSHKPDRMSRLGDIITKRKITEIIVGYPYNMNGTVGFKAKEVDAFIADLENHFDLPIHRIDERLSTHHVESELRAMGRKTASGDRKTRATGEVDSRAATVILQDYLDSKLFPPPHVT